VLWGVHLWAIRQDGRYARPSEAVPAAAVPLSVEEQRAMLEAQIAQLEQQLAAARAELEGLGRDKPV
ncbi:MAG: DUF5320 domain-containing protein, partial [Caldilineaceae bacterium]|nr:DUF5320 domain-containing protein [Caldilineaceae bacterium]